MTAALKGFKTQTQTGIVVELQGEPLVIIDVRVRRIDVVFRCRIRPPVPDVVRPASVEISEARWFRPHVLPVLQPEAAEALARLAETRRR